MEKSCYVPALLVCIGIFLVALAVGFMSSCADFGDDGPTGPFPVLDGGNDCPDPVECEVCPDPVECEVCEKCEVCEVCPEPEPCPDDETPWNTVCHVPKSGNAHTIKVGGGALDSHLSRHPEDYLGPCL